MLRISHEPRGTNPIPEHSLSSCFGGNPPKLRIPSIFSTRIHLIFWKCVYHFHNHFVTNKKYIVLHVERTYLFLLYLFPCVFCRPRWLQHWTVVQQRPRLGITALTTWVKTSRQLAVTYLFMVSTKTLLVPAPPCHLPCQQTCPQECQQCHLLWLRNLSNIQSIHYLLFYSFFCYRVSRNFSESKNLAFYPKNWVSNFSET